MTCTASSLKSESVKVCTMCGHGFTLQELLDSPDVQPIGMQLEQGAFDQNMYFFNHRCPGCGSTFLVPVASFLPFIQEEIPAGILDGTAGCAGHCRKLKDLTACGNPCHYAPFRRFLLNRLLKNRTQTGPPQG